MAPLAHLSREERTGLVVAAAAHVALLAALVWQVRGEPTALPIPERMDVSLASEVALTSTAPNPSTEPAAALAPELAPEPEPAPLAQPEPRPAPSRAAQPTPAPTPAARQTPAPTPAASPTRATGSRLNERFLEGVSDAQGSQGQAATSIGPAVQASIGQAIIRQLRPHWNPPSGVDVDQLVTVLRFRLNRDGTLAGAPEVVRQTGVNDNNRAQVARHQEQAIRAVRLAAPFNLPEEYYAGWRVITSNFDNRLAQ